MESHGLKRSRYDFADPLSFNENIAHAPTMNHSFSKLDSGDVSEFNESFIFGKIEPSALASPVVNMSVDYSSNNNALSLSHLEISSTHHHIVPKACTISSHQRLESLLKQTELLRRMDSDANEVIRSELNEQISELSRQNHELRSVLDKLKHDKVSSNCQCQSSSLQKSSNLVKQHVSECEICPSYQRKLQNLERQYESMNNTHLNSLDKLHKELSKVSEQLSASEAERIQLSASLAASEHRTQEHLSHNVHSNVEKLEDDIATLRIELSRMRHSEESLHMKFKSDLAASKEKVEVLQKLLDVEKSTKKKLLETLDSWESSISRALQGGSPLTSSSEESNDPFTSSTVESGPLTAVGKVYENYLAVSPLNSSVFLTDEDFSSDITTEPPTSAEQLAELSRSAERALLASKCFENMAENSRNSLELLKEADARASVASSHRLAWLGQLAPLLSELSSSSSAVTSSAVSTEALQLRLAATEGRCERLRLLLDDLERDGKAGTCARALGGANGALTLLRAVVAEHRDLAHSQELRDSTQGLIAAAHALDAFAADSTKRMAALEQLQAQNDQRNSEIEQKLQKCSPAKFEALEARFKSLEAVNGHLAAELAAVYSAAPTLQQKVYRQLYPLSADSSNSPNDGKPNGAYLCSGEPSQEAVVSGLSRWAPGARGEPVPIWDTPNLQFSKPFKILHLASGPTKETVSHFHQAHARAVASLQTEVARLQTALEAAEKLEGTARITKLETGTKEDDNEKENSPDIAVYKERFLKLFKERMDKFKSVVYMLTGWNISMTPGSTNMYHLTASNVYGEREDDVLEFTLEGDDRLTILNNGYTRRISSLLTILTMTKSFPALLAAIITDGVERATTATLH